MIGEDASELNELKEEFDQLSGEYTETQLKLLVMHIGMGRLASAIKEHATTFEASAKQNEDTAEGIVNALHKLENTVNELVYVVKTK